jgi:hypothetical protein
MAVQTEMIKNVPCVSQYGPEALALLLHQMISSEIRSIPLTLGQKYLRAFAHSFSCLLPSDPDATSLHIDATR